jgi:hypothetical protein
VLEVDGDDDDDDDYVDDRDEDGDGGAGFVVDDDDDDDGRRHDGDGDGNGGSDGDGGAGAGTGSSRAARAAATPSLAGAGGGSRARLAAYATPRPLAAYATPRRRSKDAGQDGDDDARRATARGGGGPVVPDTPLAAPAGLTLAAGAALGPGVSAAVEAYLAAAEALDDDEEEGGLTAAEAVIEAQRRIDASWSEPFLRTCLNIVRNSRRGLMAGLKASELRSREFAAEEVGEFVEGAVATGNKARLVLRRASKTGLV